MKPKIPFTMLKMLTFVMMLAGCISFEDTTLDDNKAEKGAISPPSKTTAKSIDLAANYSCVKDWPYLSITGSTLQVVLKEAKGNCFGFYFNTRDISETPVIKVRVKYTATSKVPSADLLAGFTDDKGGKTYNPEKAKMIKTGTDYMDYYFDYTADIKSKDRYIDPAKIKTILIFVNILGVDNVSGTFNIEEISLQVKI